MDSMSRKTCPICNASNHADALFCEECGASIAQLGSDTQSTSSFAPVTDMHETNTVQIPVAQPAPEQPYSPAPANTTYGSTAAASSYGYVPERESVRGAVLGWIAFVLMLAIAGFFVWSTLLSDATRDRFTGLF